MSEIEKPGYWAVIPASVRYDEVIPPNAKLLYAEISALTGADGYCWATNEYFQKNFGLAERTVQRLLRSLEDAGYIKVEDGDSKKRKIYAGVNPLRNRKPNPDKNVTVQPRQNCRGNPDKIVTQNNIINNNIPPKAPQGAGVCGWKPDRFQKFWDYYRPHDRRGNRQRAIKAWERLRPDDRMLKDMAHGLKLLMSGEEWARGIGIPHVATFLNNRYWEDALENAADPDDYSGGWAPDPEVTYHD